MLRKSRKDLSYECKDEVNDRYHYELVVHWMVDSGVVEYVVVCLPGWLWQCQQVAKDWMGYSSIHTHRWL